MNRNGVAAVLVALAVVSVAGIGMAQTGAEQGSISKQEAAAIAEEKVGGTATSVIEENEGGPVYEVQVERPDGSMREVEVDGNTGEVLEVESADDELL